MARTPNARNKRTKEAVERAAATGEMPADILLRLARDAAKDYDAFAADHSLDVMLARMNKTPDEDTIKALVQLAKMRVSLREHVIAAADAAAPFFNARLATIQHNHRGKIIVSRRKVTSGKGGARPKPIAEDALNIELDDETPPASGKRDPRKPAGPRVRVKKRKPK